MKFQSKAVRLFLSMVGVITLGLLVSECGTAPKGGPTPTPTPTPAPYVKLTSFQAAAVVIGQANMTSIGSGTGLNQFASATGNPLIKAGKILVSDSQRILSFGSIPTTNNATADFALTGGSTYYFSSLAVADSGAFFAAASDAAVQIPFWNSLPTSNGSADHTMASSGTSQSLTNQVDDLLITNNQLVVADHYNNRIMVWNPVPTANNSNATFQLGQANFITGTTGNGPFNASASYLNGPMGTASDGTHLFVADSSNHRILAWNQFPTSNSAPDFVLGQTDFTGFASGLAAGRLNTPRQMVTNGTQLFVCDTLNNRVLIWNQLPTTSGQSPDVVLGQSDFVHGAANDDAQTGSAGVAGTARTLNRPSGLAITANQLFVVDSANNRVLIYNAAP